MVVFVVVAAQVSVARPSWRFVVVVVVFSSAVVGAVVASALRLVLQRMTAFWRRKLAHSETQTVSQLQLQLQTCESQLQFYCFISLLASLVVCVDCNLQCRKCLPSGGKARATHNAQQARQQLRVQWPATQKQRLLLLLTLTQCWRQRRYCCLRAMLCFCIRCSCSETLAGQRNKQTANAESKRSLFCVQLHA